jgi:bidirectional [NiFe] hydrogenase diaphorase subunit
MIKIIVDEKVLEVPEGKILLQACLENDVYIPNLCFLEKMSSHPASCRLCFVEIEGQAHPVTSCTVKVTEGLQVRTDTPEVRRLQKSALRLLLSVHDIDCRHCPANKKCELQRIARFLKIGLKAKPLETILKDVDVDTSHACFDYYPNRCVLCGKCVFTCKQKNGQNMLTFAKRGFNTIVSSYGNTVERDDLCEDCRECVDICPVGALVLKTAQPTS